MVILLLLVFAFVIAIVYKEQINSMFRRFTPEELEAYQEGVILHIESIHENKMKEMKEYIEREKKEINVLIEELKSLNEDAKDNKNILKEYSNEIEYKINKYESYMETLRK